MKDNKARKTIIKNLTPQKAFEIYARTSEEIFMSNFMVDRPPVTDVKEMCRVYSKDIPYNENTLFTTTELEHITNLMIEYLESYIEKKGGFDKLELYTEEELDKMMDEMHEENMYLLAKKLGVTREELRDYFRKR